MAVIHCNHWTRALWRSPSGKCTGYFDPVGSIVFADDKNLLDPHVNPNVKRSEGKPIFSSRVFVPLHNGERARTAEDIVTTAKNSRDTMDGVDGWVICFQIGMNSSTKNGVTIEGEGCR